MPWRHSEKYVKECKCLLPTLLEFIPMFPFLLHIKASLLLPFPAYISSTLFPFLMNTRTNMHMHIVDEAILSYPYHFSVLFSDDA
uniref:Uncharacterized protein n=1 Tax=Rhipicephalus appendiculatus TaxID=34631 RepID=A0A131YGD0_RHIAP